MRRKVIIISIVIISVFLIGLICIIYKNTNKIILKNDIFIYELGEEISADVSYYLKDANSIKNITDYKIMTTDFKIVDNMLVFNNVEAKAGDYTINVVYKKTIQKAIIRVVDTISPEFTIFTDNIKVEQNTEKIDFAKYFEAKDLTDVEITIEGAYDLTKEGEYEITVIAKDLTENKTEKKSKITVYKKETNKETTVTKQETANNVSSKKDETPSLNNNNSTSSQTINASPRYRKDISNTYITQINAYRKANGLNELPVTAEAQAEADRRSKELSTYYSHDGAGYGFGEIIGNGSIGVDFITAWKNSPSHNATMLREHTVAMAASVYECNNQWYTIVSFRMDY